MKTRTPHLLLLGASLALMPFTLSFAQSTWQTVDALTPWRGRAIAVDAAGNFISLAIDDSTSSTGPVSTAVSFSSDHGLTWQTVGSIAGYALKLAAAPDGTLYASGNRSATVSGKAFIWVSLDHGTTWALTTDPWPNQSNTLLCLDIHTDSQGALYLCGILSGGNHWLVLKGQPTSGGLGWSTADNFPVTSSSQPQCVYARPAAIAGQPDEVFVCGVANGFWTVRHSPDAGVSWATIDSYTFGLQQSAYSLAAAPDGSIYVAGRVAQSVTTTTVTTNIVHNKVVISTNSTTSTEYGWLVRKSANGGTSWSNVDYLANGWPAPARGLAVDPSGRVYAVGFLTPMPYSWLVRVSADGGATWTTTDSFLPTGYNFAEAFGVAGDALGNVCVVGDVEDGTASADVAAIRRLAAP